MVDPRQKHRNFDRRTLLQTAGVAAATGLTGCLGGIAGTSESGGNTVRFIITPAESDVDVTKQYRPLFEYIESETEADVEPTRAASYNAVIEALRSDQAEIADASPSAAVAADNVADVLGIRVAYGADKYFSLITTPADSDVQSLSDIKGGKIAFSDRLSTSGSLVPLLMLKQAGLDVGKAPDGDAGDFTATYSDHTQARKSMLNRDDVIAAGTGAFSTAPHVPQAQFDEQSKQFVDISTEYADAGSAEPELRLLSVSDPLPRAPLLTRSNWEADIRSEVERVLLEASKSDITDPDRENNQLWFSGVKEGTIEDYDPIASVLDGLGLKFGDISG
jgi:phosphonate transport system substrate-binding protein